MSLRSMTGFARRNAQIANFEAILEIKSVNARGLDLRARVPALVDGFDIRIRKHVGKRLARGSVSINLALSSAGEDAGIRIDEARLARLISTAHKYEPYPGVLPARIDGLLALPGIVATDAGVLPPEERQALEEALIPLLDTTLDDLDADRAREGAELARLLDSQLETIESLGAEAAGLETAQLPAIRDRIKARLDELLVDHRLEQERLEQEASLMAVKQDIREELDRLATHVAEARSLIEQGSPAGRRLDFLAQELNREANTMCSKSGDMALTRAGLALKSAIEQFREQCQNVE